MKSLTMMGKTACAAIFAASVILSGSAWAGDHGDGNWLSRIIGSSNTPATNFAGSKGGKAVTKTEEVVATESDMRKALIGGMDPVAAYHKYGKF